MGTSIVRRLWLRGIGQSSFLGALRHVYYTWMSGSALRRWPSLAAGLALPLVSRLLAAVHEQHRLLTQPVQEERVIADEVVAIGGDAAHIGFLERAAIDALVEPVAVDPQ